MIDNVGTEMAVVGAPLYSASIRCAGNKYLTGIFNSIDIESADIPLEIRNQLTGLL
jgi:hypothetical protein